MALHHAKKVVVVTERLISKAICEIILKCGASGYTINAAGGKGSRNVRSVTEQAAVVDGFANVKIETIVNDDAIAENIMEQVAAAYFKNYSGITYSEDVKILRPEKFDAD